MGVVVDGVPAGIPWRPPVVQQEIERRRPGIWGASLTPQSRRQEPDEWQLLSGVFEDRTLGTPICLVVPNRDARSGDYDSIREHARVGHADQAWRQKFGHVDHRGGGRASGRETVSRVLAGAVARMILQELSPQTQIYGVISRIGPYALSAQEKMDWMKSPQLAEDRIARFPGSAGESIAALLRDAQENGESYDGEISLLVARPPAGLGQPVFHKLKSDLASAVMSVGAVHAVKLGQESAEVQGTQFFSSGVSERLGGIQGGISTGEAIAMTAAIKPTSSILDVAKRGRHDPCIAVRAVPVLEAMFAFVLADHLLWSRTDRV